MSRASMFVGSFTSGLDELPRKQQRDHVAVLRALDAMPRKRFSVFEVTANMDIARTMTRLTREGFIATDNSPYPWTGYEITELGRAAMKESPHG